MQKITKQDLDDAIVRLDSLPYFPKDPVTRGSTKLEIAEMMPDVKALGWTLDTAMGEWQEWKGLAGLRAILTRRCQAADGREYQLDGEARYLELQAAAYDDTLQQWKRDAKRIEAAAPKLISCPIISDNSNLGNTPIIEAPAAVVPKVMLAEPATEEELQPGPKRGPGANALLLAELEMRLRDRIGVDAA